MSYRVKPELLDAISEIERRLDEFRALAQYDLLAELEPILERAFCYLDSKTLPFVDFRSWYARQMHLVERAGGGTVRWPKAVAERLAIQLRLVFLVTSNPGPFNGFCVSFVPGSAMFQPNMKGFVRVLLRPLTVTFRQFIESDEAQVNHYVAAVVSDETGQGSATQLTEIELELLRSERDRFEHFIDLVAEPAQAESIGNDERVSVGLSPGEAELFIVAFGEREGDYFDPLELETTATVKTSRAQIFKTMRKKVDAKEKGEFRLFKSQKPWDSRKFQYRFQPDKGVSWCVVLRLDE